MISAPHQPPDPTGSPDPQRRGLLLLVGGLVAVLAVGTVLVGKAFLAPPVPQKAGATVPRDGAAAIEAGLTAAAEYQRERKFNEAAAILSKLAEQSPMDLAVRLAYAQALLGQEKFPEAYAQYEAAIALAEGRGAGQTPRRPSESEPSTAAPVGAKRDPILANVHFEAGTAANMAGMAQQAEEHYYMAQVLDAAEARYPLYLAMMQIKKGDDSAGAATLLRTVKINPELAEGWGTMAELELKKNQLTLAQQHIEKARTLQPTVSRWRVVQARVLNRVGEPEQAVAILEALPQAEHADRAVLALQAESYGLLKKPELAAAMYERAGQLVPTDAELAYAAAQWYDRAGVKAKAMQFAQKAKMLGHEGGKELLESIEKK